jgi:hypothetical protein
VALVSVAEQSIAGAIFSIVNSANTASLAADALAGISEAINRQIPG